MLTYFLRKESFSYVLLTRNKFYQNLEFAVVGLANAKIVCVEIDLYKKTNNIQASLCCKKTNRDKPGIGAP